VSQPASQPAAGGEDMRAIALDYLSSHNTVSLATIGPDGPWATTVFYVSLGFTLYFLSEPKTLHVQNLAHSATIGATVNEDYRDWREIKGIQIAATCGEVTSKRELARVLPAYIKKYPFVAQFLSPGQLLGGMKIAGKALDVRFYRVAPTRMLYLDNARGFSHREEIPLEETR
jgi:uncharacterized protein YhbP (UPF0306 family)